ncbi:MAG: hypothetical protein HY291_20295 [Planctomycetes bacterium]|nr:hypothetical protein [Planctomycetota bacterium]
MPEPESAAQSDRLEQRCRDAVIAQILAVSALAAFAVLYLVSKTPDQESFTFCIVAISASLVLNVWSFVLAISTVHEGILFAGSRIVLWSFGLQIFAAMVFLSGMPVALAGIMTVIAGVQILLDASPSGRAFMPFARALMFALAAIHFISLLMLK